MAKGKTTVVGELVRNAGLYGKSMGFFVFLAIVGVAGIFFWRQILHASEPVGNESNPSAAPIINLTLGENGNLYIGSTRLNPDIFTSDTSYRYRLSVIENPTDTISTLSVVVHLPKPATESTVSFQFINNGGAEQATGELTDPQTITYTAQEIGPDAKLAIEFTVPKGFITQSLLTKIKDKVSSWPPFVWTIISIALPALTLLVLLLVAVARMREVTPVQEKVTQLPSRMPPVMLGILLRGRISSRELAATFIDLARRGHLIIRQLGPNDFRFRRVTSNDKLFDFEEVLLEQIFGPTSDHASAEEISFGIAQELFSKRVSRAFILVYEKVNELGFFYTNPLSLHRRYQLTGIGLFILGLVGMAANLTIFSGAPLFLLFWLSMMVSALLVTYFSKGLPMRTLYGDRELARWLSFKNYLDSPDPINYAAQGQEKYLAYLPYAIVFGVEAEWTKRFYSLPFAQPAWYVAANISTIEDFTNRVFPLFGYLSHVLSLTTQPIAR